MKLVNVRKFSREMYSCLEELPLAVYNKRTGDIMFVVISEKKGSELFDLRTENLIQSKKRTS